MKRILFFSRIYQVYPPKYMAFRNTKILSHFKYVLIINNNQEFDNLIISPRIVREPQSSEFHFYWNKLFLKWERYFRFCSSYFSLAFKETVVQSFFTVRSVAQPGSALDWGSRGRGFESRRSDHFLPPNILSLVVVQLVSRFCIF